MPSANSLVVPFPLGCEVANVQRPVQKRNQREPKFSSSETFASTKDGKLLDMSYNLSSFHTTDFVKITFIFQKNQERNESVGMYKTNYKEFCPVITWAAICQRILSHPSSSLDSPVHTWQDKKNKSFKYITSNLIRVQLWSSALIFGKETLGFDPLGNRLSFHLVRLCNGLSLDQYTPHDNHDSQMMEE